MTEKEIKENLGRGKDLRGQKFERLTPLYPLKERISRNVVWHCVCDCGKETNVIASHLTSKHTRSCGCLNVEAAILVGQNKLIDLSGQQFGKLLVIKRDGTYEHNGRKEPIYLCKCECGNFKYVSRTNLKCGNTSSCGCLGTSKGEYKIAQILQQNNIIFETQKKYDTCIFSDTKGVARFDFYLPQYNVLIEYDGEQHFTYRENINSWNNKENFIKVQQRDKEKNQWCKDNNIPLIRIPYTHYDNLCIEDLLLETSQFIVKEVV